MNSIEKEYVYEVAFSFLQQDEKLAYEINDLIQDRFRTFIYSEHQAEISGTDGEKTFNEVFGEKARLVVVIFREDWGKTKWTRIEETAIRNRAHEEGYDFVIFVQLEKNSQLPRWLPKARIYYDFERWGVKGLAPVIEAKIQEAGGQGRVETVEDLAAKLKREVLLQGERVAYLNSRDAYYEAQAEFEKLYKLVEEKSKNLEDPSIGLNFAHHKHPSHRIILYCEQYGLFFDWKIEYSNSLEGSRLLIAIFQLAPDSHKQFIERSNSGLASADKLILRQEYSFDYNPITSEKGWSIKAHNTEFTGSEKLLNDWAYRFLEKIEKQKLDKFRK